MKILSFGLGVQSTTLYYMSSIGFLERVDCAIFADPGAEKPQTYRHLDDLLKWQKKNDGVPIIHIKNNLLDDIGKWHSKRFASIPAFTGNGMGQLRRQCTREYKISVINRKIREIYGLKPFQRFPKTEIWIGFSLDEVTRCSPGKEKWKTLQYPLIELEYSRSSCIQWLKKNSFTIPIKSSCIICPYQSNHNWKQLKHRNPKEFKKAVGVDLQIREMTKQGINNKIYLHRQCVPLEEVDFNDDQIELFDNICDADCGT